MIELFFSYLKNEAFRSPLTIAAYKKDIEQFEEWVGSDVKTGSTPEVTANDIRAWVAYLSREGISAVSIRRKIQSLRAYYGFLFSKHIVPQNPAKDITLPKKSKPLPEIIRSEELEKIITNEIEESSDNDKNFVKKIKNNLILKMFYTLGIRRAELIAINDEDIDFFKKEIKIHGKRNKQRIVPMPDELAADIKNWQKLRDINEERKEDETALFISKGERLKPGQVYRIVTKMLEETGGRKKNPHILRHSFATAMLNEGADLNSVKEFLGHASLATTQIYTHVSLAEIKKVYKDSHPRSRHKKITDKD